MGEVQNNMISGDTTRQFVISLKSGFQFYSTGLEWLVSRHDLPASEEDGDGMNEEGKERTNSYIFLLTR